jgi:hypothetical protein
VIAVCRLRACGDVRGSLLSGVGFPAVSLLTRGTALGAVVSGEARNGSAMPPIFGNADFVRKNPPSVRGSGCAKKRRGRHCAYGPAADPQGSQAEAEENEDARACRISAASRSLHAGVHDHAQEAELRVAQSVPRASYFGHGDHCIHPGRGSQPPRAFDRAGSWRPSQGPPRRSLQSDTRGSRRCWRKWPPPVEVSVRHEEGFVNA